MENNDKGLFGISIDETGKSHIRTMYTWVMTSVICSAIGWLLTIIQFLKPKSGYIMREESENFSLNFMTGEDNIVSVLITLLISVVLTLFLYNFARYSKKGTENLSHTDLNKGFISLKNYFLTLGILLIIVALLLLIALAFFGSMM